MGKREKWIEEALDEINPVEEMGLGVVRELERDGPDLDDAWFICSAIEAHGRRAKRALSYARKCREREVRDEDTISV